MNQPLPLPKRGAPESHIREYLVCSLFQEIMDGLDLSGQGVISRKFGGFIAVLFRTAGGWRCMTARDAFPIHRDKLAVTLPADLMEKLKC